MKTEECLLVGVSFADNDEVGVLIIGRQVDGVTKIVNAFQGQEAIDLYNKLIAKKENDQS